MYWFCLGFILIFIDLAYYFCTSDVFGTLDYGVLLIGFIIILLNMNILSFLKLDEEMTSFITYFIFIFISLHVKKM